MEIKKKTWPEYFQMILDGKKKFELRLADFELKEGDTLVLEEYEPKSKKYTGRKVAKKVKSLIKINPLKMQMYSEDEIKKHGLYVIDI